MQRWDWNQSWAHRPQLRKKRQNLPCSCVNHGLNPCKWLGKVSSCGTSEQTSVPEVEWGLALAAVDLWIWHYWCGLGRLEPELHIAPTADLKFMITAIPGPDFSGSGVGGLMEDNAWKTQSQLSHTNSGGWEEDNNILIWELFTQVKGDTTEHTHRWNSPEKGIFSGLSSSGNVHRVLLICCRSEAAKK